MSYVVLQEAATTTIFFLLYCREQQQKVDHDKYARLRKQQPIFFINVDQPHQQSQRREAPAIIINRDATTQC
jgi:hypothetical protein